MAKRAPAKPHRSRKPASTRRKATNVSVRTDLVAKARELKLNLSSLLEDALVKAIRERQQQTWLEENAEAIAACNEHMRRYGLFSDDYREF